MIIELQNNIWFSIKTDVRVNIRDFDIVWIIIYEN